MREVLLDLNQEVGVKGSAVLTRDGVLVLSEIGTTLNADAVAAVASSVIQMINVALGELDAAKRRIETLSGGDSERGIAAVEMKLVRERERSRQLEARIERAAGILFGREEMGETPPAESGWPKALWALGGLLLGILIAALYLRYRHGRRHGGFRIRLG